jgi:CBS domain-containing protein
MKDVSENHFEDPLSNYEPATYPSELHRVLSEETVGTIQTSPCIQIAADATVLQAMQALDKAGVSSLLVVEGDRLVGIFTERDVLERVADGLPQLADTPVAQVMTGEPTVIYESDPVGMAIAAIAVAGHRHVPVLKIDGSVLGIVSPKRVLSRINAYVD